MSRIEPTSSRAIVIGGSIAGLLTARVLSEYFEHIIIVDRDQLPPTAIPRRGVPQSGQPHVLFTRGYRILETLFPGIGQDLHAAGAVPIDWGKEFHYFNQGGWNATCEEDSGLVSVTCTRPLLEAAIRRQVAALPNVKWLENTRVVGLACVGEQVAGVQYQSAGQQQELLADFVVDASGRSSKAAQWLEAIGAAVPTTAIVNPHLGYATQRLKIPANWQADWKVMLISQAAPHNPRLGYLAEVEGGEWIATLGGYGKDYPPLDQEGYLKFASSLASPAFYEAVKAAQPVSEITAHRATANRWHHYEKVRIPDGFAIAGDAVCALCPVYGQGMTVSAVSALVLKKWLKQHHRQGQRLNASSFQRRLAKSLQVPWEVATGSDSQFPSTDGAVSANPVASLFQKYVERLIEKSKQEAWIHVRFTEVAHMLKSPAAFFDPKLVLKAFW